jgi:hypothetical protein
LIVYWYPTINVVASGRVIVDPDPPRIRIVPDDAAVRAKLPLLIIEIPLMIPTPFLIND